MPDTDKLPLIDEEYSSTDKIKTDIDKPEQIKDISKEVEQEVKQYDTGKPRRKTIRAKIMHDKNS